MTTQSILPRRTRLTAKQEAFCLNYFTLRNATQAAIKAGYPVNSAQQISSENLLKPVILKRLDELKAETPKDPDVADVEERKRHLTKIARHNIETPVTAGQRTTAIDILNKLDKLYTPEGTTINFNEIKIIVVREAPRALPGVTIEEVKE